MEVAFILLILILSVLVLSFVLTTANDERKENNQKKENPKTEEPEEEPIFEEPKYTYQNKKGKYVDYRTKYPRPYRCEDGHYVRSKAEREIDDFFFQNNIRHIYEPEYIYQDDTKEVKKYYPDFFLPDHKLYIEYFGLKDMKYLDKMEHKIKVFQSNRKINFTYLTPKDDKRIKEKLREICYQYNITIKQ